MNQHDILMTTVADVSQGQTDMSYKGEFQTLTTLSMRHQVCPSETCRANTHMSSLSRKFVLANRWLDRMGL